MEQYSFLADALNKFSQFTPWVQAIIGTAICGVLLGYAYYIKETVAVIISPPHKRKQGSPSEEAPAQREISPLP